jgi:hypothetical protein
MKNCTVCGSVIPEGRLKAVPHANTCVAHSNASKFAANIVSYGNAEAGELNQEIEIIRDERVMRELDEYKQMQGKYSQ